MTNQEAAKQIMKTEYHYPKSYAEFRYTDYGILYFNENNPFSNDSNHAVITATDGLNYDSIVKDIKRFYRSKNLSPCIYSDLVPGHLKILKEHLTQNGFSVHTFNNSYLVLTQDNKIEEPYTLKIKRIEKGADLSFIHQIWKTGENRSGGANRVLNIALNREDWTNYHLFVGYLENGTPVTAAAIEYIDGVGMVDDVETAEAHRGNGYARQLARYWIDYHTVNFKDRMLYVYYANPTAGRIYFEAGFTKLDWEFESWSAHIE